MVEVLEQKRSLFIKNQYFDRYCQLIEENFETSRERYTTQCHHIIPKSFYRILGEKIDNSSKNLVNLRYSDHVLAHCLITLCTDGRLQASSRQAVSWVLETAKSDEERLEAFNSDECQAAYEASKRSYRFLNLCRSDEFKKKVSVGLSRSRKLNGMSEEHHRKLSASAKRRTEENKKLGLSPFGVGHDTRSIRVHCILDTGEKYDFNSIKEAGIWWFNFSRPFGEKYSQCVFQRKILASIHGEKIFSRQEHPRRIVEITGIQWKGGDANE